MNKKQFLVSIFLLWTTYVVLLPDFFAWFDADFWKQWLVWIHEDGISNIYKHDVNYHPVILYWFAFFAKVCGSPDIMFLKLKYLKLFPLVFDFLGAVAVVWLFKNSTQKYKWALLLLLNVVYIYNTVIWGQFDSIHTAVIIMAFTALLYQHVGVAVVLSVVAFNIKMQSIIFFPLMFLLAIPSLKNIFTLTKWILMALLTQLIIVIPFIVSNNLMLYVKVIFGAVGHHPLVSLNAFNLWYWIIEGNPKDIIDTTSFLYLNYRKWGFILLFSSLLAIFIPFAFMVYKKIKNRSYFNTSDINIVFLAATLITLCFFFFPTQMHERYSHPAILLSFIYGISSGRFLLHLLICSAYFLNVERVIKFFEWQNYGTVIFMGEFIACIYFIAIIIGYIQLYKYAATHSR